MGTRGPVPLPQDESTSRHAEQQWEPAESHGVKPPSPRGWNRWTPGARAWWESAKASTVAASWDTSDWEVALRCAQTVSDMERSRPGSRAQLNLSREVSRLENILLLTPESRRRMRVPESPAGRPPASFGGDPPSNDAVPDYREMISEVGR